MQLKTIIAPSKQTAQYDLRKLFPTFCVGSPANVLKGIGAMAVYKYNLKNPTINGKDHYETYYGYE